MKNEKSKIPWKTRGIIMALLLLLGFCLIACQQIPTTECQPAESQMPTETTGVAQSAADKVIETSKRDSVPETVPTESVSTESVSKDSTESSQSSHEHIYTKKIISATCNTAELIVHSCKCGHTYTEKTKIVKEHSYEHTTIAPTVNSQGYDLFVCMNCGVSYKDNYVEKLPAPTEHTHNYAAEEVAATCTSDGYVKYTCCCGQTYTDNYVPKSHLLKEVPNSAPACTINVVVYKCSRCDYEETKETKPAAHVFRVNSTGEEVESEEEYDGSATARCQECGAISSFYIQGAQEGHELGPWENTSAMFHSRSCTVPGCMYLEGSKHINQEKIEAYPSCTTGTQVTIYCVLCNRISAKIARDDALGHDFKFNKIVKPTATEPGYDLWLCSRCGVEQKQNYISAIEHECEWSHLSQMPTCTSPGKTVYTCTICYATKEEETGAPLGHDYRPTITPPTCTEEGGKIMKCARCSESYSVETFPAAGHNYVLSAQEVATTGWPGYDEFMCVTCGKTYCNATPQLKSNEYPKGYRDGTCTIIIYKEWYKNAYVYAAHIKFTDYTRLWTECANGQYRGGTETTSHAANRVGAIFAVNGCYSAPSLDYTVVRRGKIWNGSGRASFWCPAVYSSYNGKLVSAWDGSWSTPGVSGGQIDDLVSRGLVTDTFCFGPPSMFNGQIANSSDTTRAQRTFIGTNGHPGDIWICVSDGRYNDGSSAGLTFNEAIQYLKDKGCTFGVHLDGGGSSTMYFNGSVLNAARGNQRAVVDFLVFK